MVAADDDECGYECGFNRGVVGVAVVVGITLKRRESRPSWKVQKSERIKRELRKRIINRKIKLK